MEAEGASVAIDGARVVELEFPGDGVRAGPVHVSAFDLVTIGVVADDAFTSVAFRVGG